MPSFSAKLDTLLATIDMFGEFRSDQLADALAASAGRHALAVGSGGSVIAAEYFVRCRDSLGLGPTTVLTPMQVVLDSYDLRETDVWLFSAGADNPDVIAATRAAIDRRAGGLNLVTRSPEGGAVALVSACGGSTHFVPVAELKDGYLATHSLLSSVCALLVAADAVSVEPRGRENLLDAIAARVLAMRDQKTRAMLLETLSRLSLNHTLIVACDPLVRPLAILLDTSIWEASLCHVQTTDFRNLAHGRHAWMHHRADETTLLAVTCLESKPIWAAIERVLPPGLNRFVLDHRAGGRLDNVLAIVDGLGLVEAIGAAVGIDPGKPGIGEFGRLVYEDRSLTDLASALPAHLRHKRSAVFRADSGEHGGVSLHETWRDRLEMLARANVGGAVFDYDGTLVSTEGRWQPPVTAIVDELVRLHRLGLKIGIATGRGGSAGEDLRKVLEPDMLQSILIGYYNGGHLRAADIDLVVEPPAPNPAIVATARWLEARSDLFREMKFKAGPIQITVDMDKLRHAYRFPLDIESCPAVSNGSVRITASGHSYDIVPAGSSKLTVVAALESALPVGAAVLRFGDSGARAGNDNDLLSHPFGISVGEICGAPNGCWSVFGAAPTGPDALLKILRALVPSERGTICLDVASLGLDIDPAAST